MQPSAVHYGDGALVQTGDAALQTQASDPLNTITSVKRLMGRSLHDIQSSQGDWQHYDLVADDPQQGMVRIRTRAGDKSPVEVSAEILSALRAQAQSSLAGDIDGVVITVPAYFDDAQRQATKDAAQLAGLPLLRLLNEPTAAAIAYGLDNASEGVYAVFDLGGGTFDISILRMEKGVFQVLATGGDSALGGDDYDRALAQWVQQTALQTSGKTIAAADHLTLQLAARACKHALTQSASTTFSATLADGTTLLLGHERWLQEQGIATDALSAHISAQQALGHTVTLLAIGQEAVAVFAVADTVKDHAQEALADLHALGITTAMLSGDHSATATAVAKQLGITQVHGELLPEHKLDAITSHQRQGATGMVGDGINDAPALAQADIGFAMGAGGTHIAVEAADIVIMGDDLRRIPETIRLSRQAYAVLWQNIGMALGFKAIFFATAITGHATMWMAVFADIGTTLIVIANSLRMLRWRK